MPASNDGSRVRVSPTLKLTSYLITSNYFRYIDTDSGFSGQFVANTVRLGRLLYNRNMI